MVRKAKHKPRFWGCVVLQFRGKGEGMMGKATRKKKAEGHTHMHAHTDAHAQAIYSGR